MAKVPVAGRVKTRLAADTGTATAVRFARHCTMALLQRVATNAPWQTTLVVAPDSAVRSRIWPRGLAVARQGGGNLGMRMQRCFDRALPGPLVIVGTDVPLIARAHIQAAFRLLGRHDAVFGPATDGGYWLVGLRRRPRVLRPFHGVRWSTPTRSPIRSRTSAAIPLLAWPRSSTSTPGPTWPVAVALSAAEFSPPL